MCSFLRLFVCYPCFSLLWPAFTLTVHINALCNENVHGREEHATCNNSIPLKIATLLTLQPLKWAYTFGSDVLIVSATSRHYSVLRRLARWTLRACPLRYGMSVQAPIRLSNSLLLTSL